ncbi:MAG: YlxR family protein [Chloroflexi bacterium]|nr:YlxR family protein [Chloroflexota bacterium]
MSQKKRHIPTRTCVVCREKRQRSDLLRIVRTTDGKIEFDRTGRVDGRGAYVCEDSDHWGASNRGEGINRGRLKHALKAEIDDSTVKLLSEAMKSHKAK